MTSWVSPPQQSNYVIHILPSQAMTEATWGSVKGNHCLYIVVGDTAPPSHEGYISYHVFLTLVTVIFKV